MDVDTLFEGHDGPGNFRLDTHPLQRGGRALNPTIQTLSAGTWHAQVAIALGRI